MKRLLFIAALMLSICGRADAITQSASPTKFNIPWANATGVPYIRSIPQASQIGIQNCAASLTDGFPPLSFTPPGAGGCPPYGADFNGILKQITQWSQWFSAGGPVFYDSAFAGSASNGYPNGAIIQSTVVPGDFWMSTADNNTTNPDTGGANWVQIGMQTGMMQAVPAAVVMPGYVSANGLTIGNASSNATNLASSTTQFLFTFIWTNCSATNCPIYTSAGGASSRGASAAADFAANKAIAVFNSNGAGMIGADSQGTSTSTNLSGVPVQVGSTTTTGSIIGENLHTLTAGQIPTITSSGSMSGTFSGSMSGSMSSNVADVVRAPTGFDDLGSGGGAFNFSAMQYLSRIAQTITSTGTVSGSTSGDVSGGVTSNNTGGGSHNTVERSVTVWWEIKL